MVFPRKEHVVYNTALHKIIASFMTALHKLVRCNAGLACTWNLLVTNPWLTSDYCSWKMAMSCGFRPIYDKFRAEITHAYTYAYVLLL